MPIFLRYTDTFSASVVNRLVYSVTFYNISRTTALSQYFNLYMGEPEYVILQYSLTYTCTTLQFPSSLSGRRCSASVRHCTPMVIPPKSRSWRSASQPCGARYEHLLDQTTIDGPISGRFTPKRKEDFLALK